MSELLNQIKNASEMAVSEEKRKEFNDRMNRITSKYQRKYEFEVNRDNPKHPTWNNEADAFKHTFGSALMVFELGKLGSAAGGIHHELKQRNNPEDEWNMDSWNNHQGRKIAEEIKEEYGEDNFRSLPQDTQEDIIAQKTMTKMKRGELITHPDDKRKYSGAIGKGIYATTKFIEEKYNDACKGLNNFLQHVNWNNVSYNGKSWNDWSEEEKEAFMLGFDTGEIAEGGFRKTEAIKNVQSNWAKNLMLETPIRMTGIGLLCQTGSTFL